MLDAIIGHIAIPRSYYEKASDRHNSLSDWLHRDGSAVLRFGPDVRPQGSFRYGTVIKPLKKDGEYDLDNVCVFQSVKKAAITQAELKALYGEEIKAYARAHKMLAEPSKHNRCWRLRYADEVNMNRYRDVLGRRWFQSQFRELTSGD